MSLSLSLILSLSLSLSLCLYLNLSHSLSHSVSLPLSLTLSLCLFVCRNSFAPSTASLHKFAYSYRKVPAFHVLHRHDCIKNTVLGLFYVSGILLHTIFFPTVRSKVKRLINSITVWYSNGVSLCGITEVALIFIID